MAKVSARAELLTNEQLEKMRNVLKEGHSRNIAAVTVGMLHREFAALLVNDRELELIVEQAESEAERFHLANVNRAAAAGMWTPSAWFLERKYPDIYEKRRPTALPKPTLSNPSSGIKTGGPSSPIKGVVT